MRVAIAQLRSTEDPWENLAMVQSLCVEAESNGAKLICFPENILYRGRRSRIPSEVLFKRLENGEIESDVSAFARELKAFQSKQSLTISLGSVLEQSDDPHRPYNSHWILEPQTSIAAYPKIHLFSFHQGEVIYRESDQISAGQNLVTHKLEDFKIGLSICYDLRFPELYRSLALDHGATLFLVPSAFTMETGRAHWHTLLRARAIENACYVIAPAQWGSHLNDRDQRLWCYGHSLAYDPWGELLIEGPEQGDCLLYVDIDSNRVARVRDRLPSLQDVRLW